MKFHRIAVTITLLMSPATFSAEITESYTPESIIGYTSVVSKPSINDVIIALSKKADEAGATHFKILSTGGKNEYFGTALLIR